eukprot:scaffold25998_cov122-Cylindrotheca_fusiformis.AAC.2
MNSKNNNPLACSTSSMYRTESTMMPETAAGLVACSFLAIDSSTSLHDLLSMAIALMEQQDSPRRDDEEGVSGS